MTNSIYNQNGYCDRVEYLNHLSKTYDPSLVDSLAKRLGPDEDFTGLPEALKGDFDDQFSQG